MMTGVSIFILGWYLMVNRDYRHFLFDIHPSLGIVGFLLPATTGLVIAGVGIMLEFASRKYEVQK